MKPGSKMQDAQSTCRRLTLCAGFETTGLRAFIQEKT